MARTNTAQGGGGGGTVTSISGANSIVSSPNPIVGAGSLQLVNDALSPGNLFHYGTNALGVKGWYSETTHTGVLFGDGTAISGIPDGLGGQVLTTDGAGNYSFATVAPASLTYKQVAYGDSLNVITSDSDFTRDPTTFNTTTIRSANGGVFGQALVTAGSASLTSSGTGSVVSDTTGSYLDFPVPGFSTTHNGFLVDGTGSYIKTSTGLATTIAKWPTTHGAAGEVLTDDGSGILYWTPAGAPSTLLSTHVFVGDPTDIAVDGGANFTWDQASNLFNVGGTPINFVINNPDDRTSLAESDKGFFYNGPTAPNALNAHKGFGIDFFGVEKYSWGNNNTGQVRGLIDNVAQTVFLGIPGVGVGKLNIDIAGESTMLVAGNDAGTSTFAMNFVMDAALGSVATTDTAGVPYFNINQDNTSVGIVAGASLTTGVQNAFFGDSAGGNTADGTENVFIGHIAGGGNVSGSHNIAVGSYAGQSQLGDDSIFIGRQAGLNYDASGGLFIGTAVAPSAVSSLNMTVIGNFADASGLSSTIVGAYSVGGSGKGNSIFGALAATSKISGVQNTYVGVGVAASDTDGSNNVIVGSASGQTMTTGNDRNTLIGAETDVLVDSTKYGIALGAYAVTTDNTLVVGGDNGSGNGFINHMFLGNGITNDTPVVKSYISPTGGSASVNDTYGGAIVFEGGASTGTAAGGSVQFATSNPQGTTSNTVNVPTTKAQLDGYVFSVQAGHASGTFATVGGCKMDFTADAGNSGSGDTDLYSYTTAANVLATNGDKWEAEYGGIFVTAATETLKLTVSFGGSIIFTTGTQTITANSSWNIKVLIIRVSSTVARYTVTYNTGGITTTALVSTGELTGMDFTTTDAIKLKGQAGGAGATTDHIVAKIGTISWLPGALT